MATFQYLGEDERTFPSIAVTVKSGETFDAPSDFVATNVSPIATNKKAQQVTTDTANTAQTVGE